MARASTIWVILSYNDLPLGTFTVKHEMITALERYHKEDRLGWTIRKFSDGRIASGTAAGTADQFLAANAH